MSCTFYFESIVKANFKICWCLTEYHSFIPNIYLSSGNAAANEQNIVKNGITLIINATPDLPEPTWTGVHRVKHVRVALRDRPDSDLKRVSTVRPEYDDT